MKLTVRSQFILRSQLYFSLCAMPDRGGLAVAVPWFAPRRAVFVGRRRGERAMPLRPAADI